MTASFRSKVWRWRDRPSRSGLGGRLGLCPEGRSDGRYPANCRTGQGLRLLTYDALHVGLPTLRCITGPVATAQMSRVAVSTLASPDWCGPSASGLPPSDPTALRAVVATLLWRLVY